MPTRPCPMPMWYWGIRGGIETKLQFQLKVESLWKVLISLWKQNLNWYFSHFQWSWSLANCELLSLPLFLTIQLLDSQIIADQFFIMSWQLIFWIGGGQILLQLSSYDLALRNMDDEIKWLGSCDLILSIILGLWSNSRVLRVGCEKWMMTKIGALNHPYPVSRTTDTATGVHTGDTTKIF